MTQAPALPGLSVDGLIRSGASADVYLSRRLSDGLPLAVKVFRTAPADAAAAQEAMARAATLSAVSTHPSIVTIHQAGIAGDGRVFLVMEYCSRPGLAERLRAGPLPLDETLQTMIRLSGAVETAHRSGIVHGSLAPAQVLTTDYGWPALTGFGIPATASGPLAADAASALAWAAPEMLAGSPPQRGSDVYGLATTAFALLAGAPPFAGTDERRARVPSAPAPALDRPDVPEALRRLLEQGMAADPAHRPPSAAEFARALQRVEQESHLPLTHLDVAEPAVADPEDRTSIVRRPDPAPEDRTTVVPRPELDDHTVLVARSGAAPALVPGTAQEDDDRTMLVRRPAPEPEDRTTVVARLQPEPAPEDPTTLVRRPATEPEDRTTVAARPVPESEDRTTVVPRPAATEEDRTVIRAASAPGPAIPDTAAPESSRAAYDPGAEGARGLSYGIRDAPTAPPVHRAAPSAAPPPTPTASAASRRRVRARLRVRLILLAAGTLLVLAATIGAIVVLSTSG